MAKKRAESIGGQYSFYMSNLVSFEVPIVFELFTLRDDNMSSIAHRCVVLFCIQSFVVIDPAYSNHNKAISQ